MADYIPNVPPPGIDPVLHQFLDEQFRYISEAFQEIENIRLKEENVAIPLPREGMIALADGTNWDPGSGAGFYGFHNSVWIFLGSAHPAQHIQIDDEANTDAFVVNALTDPHCYHTNGLAMTVTSGFTFDAGGAGTSFPIASIADGAAAGVDIAVTTTGSHLLATGDVISQTNLADAAYVGVFVVKAIISATIYEVAAVFTATGTGTMDQAATITADAGTAGTFVVSWNASLSLATGADVIDFNVYKAAAALAGSTVRQKITVAGDFASVSGEVIATIAVADKLSLVLVNSVSAGNITLRNLALTVKPL